MARASSKQSMRGFTLVEVLVVLVIIGIASLVIIPMIGNTDHMQVVSASREVVSSLLYAQTLSITQQQEYQVVFNTSSNRYEIQNASGVVVDDPINVGQPYRVDLSSDRRYKDVVLESASFDGTGTVWFDRMGAPYSGSISSSPPPLTTGAVVLRGGDTRVQVAVEPVSGQVSVTEL